MNNKTRNSNEIVNVINDLTHMLLKLKLLTPENGGSFYWRSRDLHKIYDDNKLYIYWSKHE